MKFGTSHTDWLAGNLPVVPYPATAFRTFGLTLKYSYTGILGYDVLVLPKQTKAGDAAGQEIYQCELHRPTRPLARRLLLPAQDALII